MEDRAEGRVQDCGCIALPEELQQRTGLHPGATFQIELTLEGNLLLTPLQLQPQSVIKPGVRCG